MTSKTFVRSAATFLAGCLAAGAVLAATRADAHREPWREGPREFSARDFNGNYGMLETGKAEGADFIEVALVRADGAGALTIEFVATLGAELRIESSVTCTYEVKPNGMGAMFCIDDNSGQATDGDFVLSDGGREVKIITRPNEAGWTTAVARRQ